MLEHEKVPRFDLSAPGLNPHLTGLLEGSRLDVPTETDQPLGSDALVGVSVCVVRCCEVLICALLNFIIPHGVRERTSPSSITRFTALTHPR